MIANKAVLNTGLRKAASRMGDKPCLAGQCPEVPEAMQDMARRGVTAWSEADIAEWCSSKLATSFPFARCPLGAFILHEERVAAVFERECEERALQAEMESGQGINWAAVQWQGLGSVRT